MSGASSLQFDTISNFLFITVCLCAAAAGTGLSWTSPALPQLTTGNGTLTITANEGKR